MGRYMSADEFCKSSCEARDVEILGYESPIQVVLGQMRMEQEDGIFRAVQDQGVIVDKDELIKALQYDRQQYEKGYRAGYNAGLNASKWIPVTERLPEDTDGKILVTDGKEIYFSYRNWLYTDGNGQLYSPAQGKWNGFAVTHWMPLPAPPTESEVE